MEVTLQQAAALEAGRMARGGAGFSLVRIAPSGWAALDHELRALEALVRAHLRKTDCVRVRGQEVGVVLIESVNEQVLAPLERLRRAAGEHLPKMELRIAWASVVPGQRRTWEEAWRWAGMLLVAEAAAPAAA